LDLKAYITSVKLAFEKEANPTYALKQKKYMRGQFEYYGLKSKEARLVRKEIYETHGFPKEAASIKKLVRLCFKQEFRELHYFGIEIVEKNIKKQEANFITFLEEMITTKSWWDTVDWINNLVGIHFKRYPELQKPYAYKWIDGENIWLVRIAIIHQLKYKTEVDKTLLFDLIYQTRLSDEFFIRKAGGWALRQLSRVDAAAVIHFVEENPDLSGLTKREALRLLKKNS
jgi:3-methyladenine DNA glycosylase AlkD